MRGGGGMITVAIVEDEETNTRHLKSMLEQFGRENGKSFVISCFSNGINFISDYTANYDLVFMDIDMPHMNGIETARLMRKLDEDAVLVFVTNLAKYAIRGYEVAAADFLVKPVEYGVFCTKLKKVLKHVKSGDEPLLVVKSSLGKAKVLLSDIYYISVAGRYVMLHTKNGDVLMRISMKELEKQLKQYNFVRCDTSSMVNLAYVTTVNRDSAEVNGVSVPCSRNRRKALLDAFTLYLR